MGLGLVSLTNPIPKHTSGTHLTELQLPCVLDRERVERTGGIVAPIKEAHLVGGGGDGKDEALRAQTTRINAHREKIILRAQTNIIQVMRREKQTKSTEDWYGRKETLLLIHSEKRRIRSCGE